MEQENVAEQAPTRRQGQTAIGSIGEKVSHGIYEVRLQHVVCNVIQIADEKWSTREQEPHIPKTFLNHLLQIITTFDTRRQLLYVPTHSS